MSQNFVWQKAKGLLKMKSTSEGIPVLTGSFTFLALSSVDSLSLVSLKRASKLLRYNNEKSIVRFVLKTFTTMWTHDRSHLSYAPRVNNVLRLVPFLGRKIMCHTNNEN